MQLNALYNGINEERETISMGVRQKTRELNEKLEKLEERFAIGEIESELLKKMKAKFTKERDEMEDLSKPFSFSTANLENYINYSFEIIAKLPSMWSSSSYTVKRGIQKMIFPEGIFYNKKRGQTRTEKLNSIFCLIAGQQRVSAERKRDLSFEFKLKSLWVVPTRIELALLPIFPK